MPRTIREFVAHPITLREARVSAIEDLTPGMRRLVLTGPELGAFVRQGYPQDRVHSDGFDDHIKLLLPTADGQFPPLPEQAEGRLAWNREAIKSTRNYTVRAFDPERLELVVDVVRHDHGLASQWAANVTIGDPVWFAGPKECVMWPHSMDWYLIGGDETALPAIARWVEEAPAGTRAQIFIELTDEAHRQDLALQDGMELTWVGPTREYPSPLLAEAIMAAPMWPGSVYAYVAGESIGIKPLRRYLRQQCGLPADRVEIVGYWRHQPETDENAKTVDIDSEVHALAEQADLMRPVIMRAAVTSGLVRALSAGPLSLAALATRTGIAGDHLERLLLALASVGFTELGPEGYVLTPLGADLDDEALRDVLDLGRPAARAAYDLVELMHALGVPVPRRNKAAETLARHEHFAQVANFVAADIASLKVVADAAHVTLRGYGTSTLAEMLLRRRADRIVTVVATEAEQVWIREDLKRIGHPVEDSVAAGRLAFLAPSDPLPRTEATILAWDLSLRTDELALATVAAAAGAGPHVVVAEHVFDEEAHDHDCSEDLTHLAAHGTSLRRDKDLEALLTQPEATRDWSLSRDISPWVGVSCLTLTRP